MHKIIILFVFPLTLVACSKSEDSKSVSRVDKIHESIYKKIPDSPLELYCYVDQKLDAELRSKVCTSILTQSLNDLTLNLAFKFTDSELDTMLFQSFYYDENGSPKKDTVVVNLIKNILNSVDVEKLALFKNIIKDEFVLRMELERFCNGYIYKSENPMEQIRNRIKSK